MSDTRLPEDPDVKNSKTMSLNAFLTRLIWYCILPLALLAVWLAVDHVMTSLEQRDRQAERLAQNATAIIDGHLDAQIAALEILAGSVLADDPRDWPVFYQRALGYRNKFPGHVIFADKSKRMIFNTRFPFGSKLPDLPEVEGRAAAPEALRSGKPAVGDTFMGPVAGQLLIAIAVPVIRDGKTRYLLLTTIEVSHIKEHLDPISLPQGWTLTALDSKGAVIARNGPHPDEPAPDSATRQFSAKSKTSHWTVVLSMPRDIYMAPAYATSAALLGAILLALFVGILGGRLAGRRLSRELKALAGGRRSDKGIMIAEIAAAGNVLANTAAALRESEEIFSQFLEHSPIYVYFKDENIRAIRLSRNFETWLGRPMPELINKNMDELFPPDLARSILADDIRILMEGKTITVDEEWNGRFYTTIKFPIHIEGKPRYLAGYTIDVTERKKAEDELREKEIQYRNLADSGLALIWTSGTDKLCNYFNLPWLKFTGRTLEQELGTGWAEGVHPDDLDRCMEIYVTSFDKREPFDMEYRLRHASGDYRWIRDMGTPNYNSSGEFIGYIGHCFDITEHRKAESELRRSENRLKEVQEMARLGHWSWDVKTGEVVWSDEVYKIFRLDPKEFTPKIDSIMALSPWPEDHERDRELIGRAIESHDKGSYEQRFLFPDNSVGYYYSTFQGRYDENGNLISIVGSVMDITELKRAESARLEAESRYHILFDQSPDGIVIVDPETARIMEFNETACRQLGYTRGEFSKLAISDFETDDTPEEIRVRIDRISSRGREDFETHHRTAKGETRIFHITAISTVIAGRPALHCVCRDITDRRRLEDQLRHAQKLEGIGQLAGGIAHDFNNILNAVIGYSGLIERQVGSNDQARHFAEEITAAGMRGAALTRQILAFSRKQTMDMKPVNINAVIDNLLNMLRRLVREDIAISLKLTDRDLIVMADPDQLDQVLINLTTNARDAMTAGGAITISTDLLALDEEFIGLHGYGSPGEYAVIKFSDTGAGMDTKTREKIFDPFFTTKETGKGTGLGLAVVHGIIRQHGGYINVYSEPDKGTVFNIFLPLTEAVVEEAAPGKTTEPEYGSETILIAEDESTLRRLTKTILEQYGYKVIEAVDGEDAIQKFAENSKIVSLVVLDGIMPRKNGWEAFIAIRKIRPDIKTIFVSGYADGSFSQRDISETNSVFLQKPVRPADLLSAVRKTLDITAN